MMWELLGFIVLGFILVFGLLYVVTATGLLGNLLIGIANAIAGAICSLVLSLIHLVLDALRMFTLPILIGLGLFLLIWMIKRTFF